MSTATANWLPQGTLWQKSWVLRAGAALADALTLRSWVVARVLKKLPAPASGWVLEAGCGTAQNLRRLARRWPHATLMGTDTDALALTLAQQMGLPPNVTLRLADAAQPPPEARCATTLLVISVLQYLPNPQQALAQWAQAVPSGCLMVLYVPVGQRRRVPGWHALMQRLKRYDYDAALGGARLLPSHTWQHYLAQAGWTTMMQGHAYGPAGQIYYDLWSLTVAALKASAGPLKLLPLLAAVAQLPLWWTLMALDYLWPLKHGNGWWAVLRR